MAGLFVIGLLFFGSIGLWWLIALYLGIKLPKWSNLKTGWSFLFVPLVFFLPVWDEVIALPQMWFLCRKFDGYHYKFAVGMDEKTAAGRTVYFDEKSFPVDIFPSTIDAEKGDYRYIDVDTGETIFSSYSYSVHRGWLGIPAGSSGRAMTLFLHGCTNYDGIRVEKLVREKFQNLNIKLIPKP